jgi:tripartite ATP-independent transporter DctP family solute receptor
MNRWTQLLFGSLVLALLAGRPASADMITLKFGHVGAPGSLFQQSAEEFAKRVNAKLAGKVKIEVFGASQLGGDKELLQKLKLGTVDFALPSTVMSTVVDQFGLFELPYLVKNRAHMKKIEQAIFWPTLEPLAEAKGYKILAVWENGFRNITNSRHPIKEPADLKGIKLRVPKGKWRVKMFEAYGANPTPMAFSDVFVALQTGVIDGEENPLVQIYSAKFQEVQKYLSLSHHVYTPAYVAVGKAHWEKLPADIRKVIEQEAKDTQAYVYKAAAKLDDELLGKLKAGGMQVNEVDKPAFVKASAKIYEEFGKEVKGAKELIDKAQSLAPAS